MSESNGKPLPKGWVETTIGDILYPLEDGRTLHQGWSPQCLATPAPTDDDWGVLKTTAIQAGAFLPEHNKQLPPALDPRPQIEVKAGDLLLTCAGPRVRCGVACLVRNTRPRLMMSGKMYRFRVSPNHMDPRFVEAYLLSPRATAAIDKIKTGSSDSGLNLTHDRFRPLQVPLAPLNEQQRIMDVVDELLSDLDAGVAALEQVRAKLKRYRGAVLKAAACGELTADWREKHPATEPATELLERILVERRRRWEESQLQKFKEADKTPPKDWKSKYKEPASPDTSALSQLPKGWSWATVEQLSTKVVDGVHKKPNYVPSGIPFVTVRNLTAGPGISFEKLNYVTPEDHAEFIKRADPKRGDILISKDGTLGVVRAVECDTEFSIFVSVALVKPVLRETGSYLATALCAPQVQVQMVPKGSGLVHIHLEDLREDCVPIPPLQEQAAIVEAVEDQLSVIDHLEADLETRLRSSTGLRQSILRHAFSGQLVPQNPGDEPASELLTRIAAEREQCERQAQAERNGKPKPKTPRKRTTKAKTTKSRK